VLDAVRDLAATGQTYHRLAALRVLARHEPKDPELLKSLLALSRDSAYYYSSQAYEIIGLLGEEAKAAVGELRTAMKDPNVIKRVRAAAALWKIEKKAGEVLPVLIAALNERDPNPPGAYYMNVQRTGAGAAALGLGDMGPAAKDALPALRQAMKLGDVGLRQNASAAIAR